jgi:spoIIIJ-associated protein
VTEPTSPATEPETAETAETAEDQTDQSGAPTSAPTSDPTSDPADDQASDQNEQPDDQPDDSVVDRLENEGDIAADYLEELLDIADLDGDLDQLVGRNGEVLEALQELTRLAVYRETGERSRLMLDIGGYRADKRRRLEKLAEETVAEVRDSGEAKALDAMTPFERKVVHDVVAAAGLSSESEGEEPDRHVVVLPA